MIPQLLNYSCQLDARETMTAPAIRVDDVHRYIERVKNRIEHCIRQYMNEEQIIDYIFRAAQIPPYVTSIVWRWLRESNPEFFNEYSLRLQLVRQIKTFNALLSKQFQLIRVVNNPPQPPPIYNPNLYYCQPPLSPFDQNFTISSDDQLTRFHDTSVLNTGIVLPQDTSPSYPFYPVNNGSSHNGNNMNAPPNCMVSVPNSYGVPNGNSFMHQNYPRALPSSTFLVNGNMPQLPMMHDSSLLLSSGNQIGGPYTSLLQTNTSSNPDVDSPMNTEDENGTVTHLAIGGLTMDESPSSVRS